MCFSKNIRRSNKVFICMCALCNTITYIWNKCAYRFNQQLISPLKGRQGKIFHGAYILIMEIGFNQMGIQHKFLNKTEKDQDHKINIVCESLNCTT